MYNPVPCNHLHAVCTARMVPSVFQCKCGVAGGCSGMQDPAGSPGRRQTVSFAVACVPGRPAVSHRGRTSHMWYSTAYRQCILLSKRWIPCCLQHLNCLHGMAQGQPSESEVTWLMLLLNEMHKRSMPKHIVLRTLVGLLLFWWQ